MRLRLGSTFTEDGAECRLCGIPVDSRMSHAQCCDRSNATKGHYKVRDCVHVLASIHDPLAQLKTTGLSPSYPQLRPADIFCSGPIGLVALDINVSSPFAKNAGDDCCDTSFKGKCKIYKHILPELVSQGIVYTPLCFSAFGRMYEEVVHWLDYSAKGD